MNGWVRAGILLTALWTVAVTSYAIYEFITFPMKPFVGYMTAIDPYVDEANKFYFIQIVTETNGDNLSAQEKAYFDQEIRDAKTDEEKSHLIEVRNVPESSSGLNNTFFIFLFGTILLFWSISYGSVAAFRWIARGFKESNKI